MTPGPVAEMPTAAKYVCAAIPDYFLTKVPCASNRGKLKVYLCLKTRICKLLCDETKNRKILHVFCMQYIFYRTVASTKQEYQLTKSQLSGGYCTFGQILFVHQ